MIRNLIIVGAAGTVMALPFVFRQRDAASAWQAGDPVLVIVSPHNEAIRYEFAGGFSEWHARRHGRPVKVDWRNIGGTTEIMRYLGAEYVAAFRAWWIGRGQAWPRGGGEMILDARFEPDRPPEASRVDREALSRWEQKKTLHQAFRSKDDPAAYTCGIDLFFGGGSYDHGKAFAQGLTVAPWPADQAPADTISAVDGRILIPESAGGESWRTATYFGNALSTFGICYNLDRLKDLGLPPPRRWEDLTDPRYLGQIGLADPTKSGSIAKVFEMMVQEQCRRAVRAAGFSDERTAELEAAIVRAKLPPGTLPDGVPETYQAAVEQGWFDGLRMIQRIAANARYFTDSSSKVPIDVSVGDAAAGAAIDFYGRFQAENNRAPGGRERMVYITPAGGSGVSADPISLLRGAQHRDVAVRFMEFVLGEGGQKLWNGRPGTAGGPVKFSLRRLPARRDFYPSEEADLKAAFERHATNTADNLGDPAVNPYELARQFTYEARWTGAHFGVMRDLIRAMCMDSGEELRAAWKAILEHGGPERQGEAVRMLGRMPERPEMLTWTSALVVGGDYDRMDCMREWTLFFRQSYRETKERVE